MFLKSLGYAWILLLTCGLWTRASTLEGVVKDSAGHPVKGADIRVEAKSENKFAKVVKTDATGHYAADGLPTGSYKVSLIVEGAVKASILNATTRSDKPSRLNFELTSKIASSKKHMVWIPAETGTHIGNGQWVEVDEKGNVADHSGVSSVTRTSAGAISNLKTTPPRSPTGN